MNNTFFVTGSTGTVGKIVVNEIVNIGNPVYILARDSFGNYLPDLIKKLELIKITDSMITLIHCGWNTSKRDFVNQRQTFEMSCELLDFCAASNIDFINFSSFSEKNFALSFYSQFKYLLSEKVLSKNGKNILLGFVPVDNLLEKKIFSRSIFVEVSSSYSGLFIFPLVKPKVLELFLKDCIFQKQIASSETRSLTVDFSLMGLNCSLMSLPLPKYLFPRICKLVIHLLDLFNLRSNFIDRIASLIDTSENITDKFVSKY
jgi:hypothetical protein